jgi:surface-adhesin protein E
MVGGTKILDWSPMPFTPRPFPHIHEQCTVTYRVGPFLKLTLGYVFGFWLQMALLVLSSGLAYAKWVAVERNNQLAGSMTVYVDPDTIHRKGDLVMMWQLIDFKTMQGGRSPSRFSSMKMQKQFDCVEARVRLLRVRVFWGNMGTGDPTEAYVEKGNWVLVEPDSVDQALWEVACNKQ